MTGRLEEKPYFPSFDNIIEWLIEGFRTINIHKVNLRLVIAVVMN